MLPGASLGVAADSPPAKPLKRVAAINTVYRLRSHAYHIAGRFVFGYSREGFHHQPAFKLVRMFNDQYPADDMSRDLGAGRHRIDQDRCRALGGPDKLDVDAVLLIGEHGDYPTNEFGQILYPRFELFSQIVDVFRRSGRSVPVFNDKHLCTTMPRQRKWSAGRELKFGFMAGSSLPVTWRRPELEPPLGTPFTEGLCCYGGSVEPYLFHGLETLQCCSSAPRWRNWYQIGRGAHGTRGLEGWRRRRWSWKLLRAALSRCPSQLWRCPRQRGQSASHLDRIRRWHARHGLEPARAYCDFNFAGRLPAKSRSRAVFIFPRRQCDYFDALTANIEKLFTTGQSPIRSRPC